MQRSAGPAVYARYVLDLLARGDDVELVDGRARGRADVLLSLDGRVRTGRGRRTVTAVLDLGHLFERRGYRPAEWLAQNWRVASAVRRSDGVLAPSQAVAYGLERYLRAPAERVTVLAPQPRPCFRRAAREYVGAARRSLGLPERYLLFVGTRSRRKNLGLLALAWRAASERLGGGVSLVLAGPGPGGGVSGALDIGYVPLELLPALISGAVAWVNPSLYEGCAVGALEAMACGAPVLVAGTGAQARAVGMAGVVLDPHDAAGWADAMVAVATDEALRARLGVSSLKAAAEVREQRPRAEELLAALCGEGAAAR